MVEPERGLNIGFTARAMMNFGFNDLRFVHANKRLLGPAARFASHASKIVEEAGQYESIESATQDVAWRVGTTAIHGRSVHNVLRTPSSPHGFAKNAAQSNASIGIILGREGTGLSNEELESCDCLVTIPTSKNYPTMNVSHAATILLYELRQHNPEGRSSPPEPRRQSYDRLISHFDMLIHSADIPAYKQKLMLRAWQNTLGRAQVSYRETSLLLGALRKIRVERTARQSRG